MTRTRWAIGFIATLTICLSTGEPDSARQGSVAAANSPLALKIGVSGGINYTSLAVYFADGQGIFAKHGIKAEVREVRADTVALQGLVARDFDAILTSAGTVIQAAAGGAALKIVDSPAPRPEYFFVAQKSIGSLKDMEGKVLGVSSPGAVSYLAPRVVMHAAGVDMNKVKVLSIGTDVDRARALAAKTIDGCVLNTVNTVAVLKTNPGVHQIADVGAQLADTFLLIAIAVRPDTIESNRTLVQRMVDALVDASRALQRDREAAIGFMRKDGRVPADSLEEAYDRLTGAPEPFFGVDGGLNQAAFESTVAQLTRAGTLKTSITWAQLVDPSFVKASVEKLGPYQK
jgi:ABC-type nitrate/sulfonate/bicarbonate transport system substrate-binding protein